jgi:hypothetical protein
MLKKNIKKRKRDKVNQKKSKSTPGVFISAKKIINSGEISSKGPDSRTEITTESYKGTGTIKSEQSRIDNKEKLKKWWKDPYIMVPAIIAILIAIIQAL